MERFKIINLLSSSSVSKIYEGLDQRTGKKVAVKELLLDLELPELQRKDVLKQFHIEIGLYMKLNHPNLPKIIAHMEEKGSKYLVLEFVEGDNLFNILNSMASHPEERKIINWAKQICSGLNYLHQIKPRPVVFRNLKPENIFLDKKNRIKIFGFGISKVLIPRVKTLPVAKTANIYYSPPEQYSGTTDITSDIYSLGATLYYITTGKQPPDSMERAIEEKPLIDISNFNKDISKNLTSIIYKSMNLKKAERFQSIDEIENELKNIQIVPRQSESFRMKLPKKRHSLNKKSIIQSPQVKQSGKRINSKVKKLEMPNTYSGKVSDKIKELRSPDKKFQFKDKIPLIEKNFILKDRYKVIDLVLETELNRIYRAIDLENKKTFAVKELLTYTYLIKDGEHEKAEIFLEKVNALLNLKHPTIPQFITDGFYKDKSYLIMEYIEGQDLSSIVENSNELPPVNKVIEWSIQICEALSYLHNRKPKPFIFRGLSPENVLLNKKGVIKLLDFGLSKLFVSKEKTLHLAKIALTSFSPPEQYSGKTEERSDIYSLGATMYFLLTGNEPEDSTDRVIENTPLRPVREFNQLVPFELEEIILKSLELRKTDRFENVKEFQEKIELLYPEQKKNVQLLLLEEKMRTAIKDM